MKFVRTSFNFIERQSGMSDIREELEKNFASAETQSKETNANEEQPVNQEPAVTDEWMDAPKAYKKEFQDSFKTLSPEWRKYLIEREKQSERGFSDMGNKLNDLKWVDDLYNTRAERLKASGYSKAQEYIEQLAQIEDALSTDPQSTLQALAEAYGVKFNDNTALSSLQRQVNDVQQLVAAQRQYIQQQQQETGNRLVNEFVNAKDEAGNPKHPYFNDVREVMTDLIRKGAANDLDTAYNMAIWTNGDIREKLIQAEKAKELATKVDKAQKAKDAGFNPTSKTVPPAKEETLRDSLERIYEELNNG